MANPARSHLECLDSSGSSDENILPKLHTTPTEGSCQNHDRINNGIPEYVGGDDMQVIYTMDSDKKTGDNTTNGCSANSSLNLASYRGSENLIDASRRSAPSSDVGITDNKYIDESSFSCTWSWNVPSLPKVPPHVPMERGSLRLNNSQFSSTTIITNRISDFMRLNSITCSYYTKDARVDCMTGESCLKFVVQLWKDDNEIIVEVQRRRGCSVAMQCIRRCLYKSIMTNSQEVYRKAFQTTARHHRRPSPVLEKCSVDECKQLDRIQQKLARNAQIQCLELMESGKTDENRLGIESLLVLTDPTKTSRRDAEDVARALIYDEGFLAERLRPAYLTYLQRRWVEGGCWSEKECGLTDDDVCCLEFSSRRSDLFHEHLLALKVLVNCLDLIARHEEEYLSNDATLLIRIQCPFWSGILNILVVNLQNSCQRPQEAALSAKCIRLLECLGPDIVTPFVEHIVAPLLQSAYEFGRAHHLYLQKESARLLHAMQASH